MLLAALLGASSCTPTTKPAPNDTAPASVSAPTPSASAAPAPEPGSAFRCFSWAHQRDFSTDCYRTATECLREATSMREGARLPTDCAPRDYAWCTTLPEGKERCFGDALNCGRYRAFVGGNHLDTTECVPR